MPAKSAFRVPTKDEVFGTDFPFGDNAPQDCHDSHGLSGHIRLSSTFKEKQRVPSQSKETGSKFDLGDLGDYVSGLHEWLGKQLEPEHWRSPLFEFARFCKAHPQMTTLSDHEAMRKIDHLMRDWERLPSGEDPWEFFFPDSGNGEVARLDFMSSWNAVRHLPFHDPLSNALRLADQRPLGPQARGVLYQRFISVAAWLQVLFPEKPIFLPTRKIGELLGCDQRTVSRLRALAVQDGLLTIAKQHSYSSVGRRQATEFRFSIDRFPGLVRQSK